MVSSRRTGLLVAAVFVIVVAAGLLSWLLGPVSAFGTILRGLMFGLAVGLVAIGLNFGRRAARRIAASTPRLSFSRDYLVPGQVPPPPVFFVGHKELLDRVAALLPSATGHRQRPFILLIHGEAGVGKSGLARKLAAEVGSHFTDGVLFTAMTEATAGSDRLHNVLGDLVDSLQGPRDTVPESTAARRAEFVRLTRRKRRVLYLFDDVVDVAAAEQVMPHTSRSVVLITSRLDLSLLGGVTRERLDPLTRSESAQLLRLLLGNPGPEEADPAALARVVASAAGYPLALNLAARAIANQGLWALPEITAGLPDEPEAASVERARERMLDLSFSVLSRTQKKVLLSLAWLREPVFVPWMAQALSDLPDEDDVWLVCERLADERLLERITPDATGVVRLRMSDRVEEYVKARAARELTDADAVAALARLDAMTEHRGSRSLDAVLEMLNRGRVARALDEARGVLADAVGLEGTIGTGQPPNAKALRAYGMIAEILAELGGLDDAMEIARAHIEAGDRRGSAPAVPEPVAEAQLRRTVGRLLRRAWRLDDSVSELRRATEVAGG